MVTLIITLCIRNLSQSTNIHIFIFGKLSASYFFKYFFSPIVFFLFFWDSSDISSVLFSFSHSPPEALYFLKGVEVQLPPRSPQHQMEKWGMEGWLSLPHCCQVGMAPLTLLQWANGVPASTTLHCLVPLLCYQGGGVEVLFSVWSHWYHTCGGNRGPTLPV